MPSPARWSRLSAALAVSLTVLLLSCLGDAVGPAGTLTGQFAIRPHFQHAAAGVVPLAAARITLTRVVDGVRVIDTTIQLATGDSTVDLSLRVAMLSQQAQFLVRSQLITPAGDTAFRAGPTPVTPTAEGSANTPVVDLAFAYDGVGRNAVGVQVLTPDTMAFTGDAVTLRAIAVDSAGEPIAGTPIAWRALDTTFVLVTNGAPPAYAGQLTGAGRGMAVVMAELLTAVPPDTTRVTLQPPPSAIAVLTGDMQSALTDAPLPDSILLEVRGADGLGVAGVRVSLVTADAGVLAADTVVSQANGRAWVHWTLGPAVGLQTVIATAVGFSGVTASITGSAVSRAAVDLTVVSGDAQTATVGTTLTDSLVVLATDGLGNPVAGASVQWSVTQNDGVVNPAVSLSDAQGLARTSLAVGTVTGANGVRAALPGGQGPMAADTVDVVDVGDVRDSTGGATAAMAPTTDFTATGTTGPASALSAVSGGAQSDTVGATLAIPLVAMVGDTFGNPVSGVSVTFAVTAGGGVLSDTTLTSDALGQVSTTWTLGTGAGAHAVTATSGGLSGSPVTFTATATAGAPAVLAFTVQPADTAAGDPIAPAVAVTVRDGFGNTATGSTDTVTLGIANNPAGGVLSGTLSVAASAGVAVFGDLSIDAPGIGYTLAATAPGLTPDTSVAFNVLTPQGQVRWINLAGGTWSTGANWSTGTPPGLGDIALIDQAGTYTVTVNASDSVGAVVIAAGGPTLSIVAPGADVTLTVTDSVINGGTIALTQTSGCCTVRAAVLDVGGVLVNTGLVEALSGPFSGTRTVTGRVENLGTLRATTNSLTVSTADTILSAGGTLEAGSGLVLRLSGTTVLGTGTVPVGNGTIQLAGTALLASTTTFPSGGPTLDLNGASAVTVAGTGTLVLANANTWSGNDVVNADLTVDATGTLTFGNGSPLLNGAVTINAGGLVTLNPNGGDAIVTANGAVANAGTITLTQSSGCCTTRTAQLIVASAVLQNTGVIQALSGPYAGVRTVSGRVNNLGILRANSNDLTVSTGDTILTAAGTLEANGGLVLRLSGTTVLGTSTVPLGAGTVQLAGTAMLASTTTFPSGGPALDLNGGSAVTVEGPGTLVLANANTWSGNDVVNADLTVDATGTLTFGNGSPLLNGAVTVNAGGLVTLNPNGANTIVTANGTMANAGTITLTQSSGCCTTRTAQLIVANDTLQNTGLIQALSGPYAGVRTVSGRVNNLGILRANSNDLTVATADTILSTAGTLEATSGAGRVLRLSGTTVLGTGTSFAGPGVVQVAGTLTLATTTTFPSGGPSLDLNGGSVVIVNGPGTLMLDNSNSWSGDDTVHADLTVGATGTLAFGNGSPQLNGAVSVNAGGAFTLDPNGGDAIVTANSAFANAGTITLTQSSGCCTTRTAQLIVANDTLQNTGLIQALSGPYAGVRTVSGRVNNLGILRANSNDLTVATADTILTTGGTLEATSGAGRILRLSGTTVMGTGTVFTGPGVIQVAGTLSLASTTTFAAGGPSVDLDGGSAVTVNGPGTLVIANASTSSGSDIVNADLTVDATGSLTFGNGSPQLNGAVTINAGGALTLSPNGANAIVTANGTVSNAGTITLTQSSGCCTVRTAELVVATDTLQNTGALQSVAGPFAGVRRVSGPVANTGTINVVNNDLTIGGALTSPGTVQGTVTGATARTLTVAGFDVDSLLVSGVRLVSLNGAITRFDNVTFTGHLATATQLTIDHPGGVSPFVFTGLVFGTVPTSGYYLSVTDNTADANILTITLVGPTPSVPSGFVLTSGGAIVNWP